jgi:hypothetical protein
LPVLFKTFETVAVDTPAALATSRMVRPITLAFRCPRPIPKLHRSSDNQKRAACREYKTKKMLDNMQNSVISARLSG